ncbi:MAG: DUF357 domain-containing protein [Nanoarchaeota archaeon]|nr:DUF357 domain-containing protein [Nanoarchaeota archaeon]
MDMTQKQLETETRKWLARLEQKCSKLQAAKTPLKTKVEETGLENIHAYVADCKHFMKQDDWVLAFEAVVYAWGIYETLERLQLLAP